MKIVVAVAAFAAVCPFVDAQTRFTGSASAPVQSADYLAETCDSLEFADRRITVHENAQNNRLMATLAAGIVSAPGTTDTLFENGLVTAMTPTTLPCTKTANGSGAAGPLASLVLSGNAYAYKGGGGGPNRESAGMLFEFGEVIEITSTVTTTLEIPIRIVGSVQGAESFGDPGQTYGRASLSIEGTIDGQVVGPFGASVDSSTVIPTMDSVNVSMTYSIPVTPGTRAMVIDVTGEAALVTQAQSAGFGGFIVGSATAQIGMPEPLTVGNFTGPGGGPVPDGVRIVSMTSGAVLHGDLPELYCPAVAGSTGVPATIGWAGSTTIAQGQFDLSAGDAPPMTFGYFLASLDRGLVANPGGSLGNLCLSGSIGRAVGSNGALSTGMDGSFAVTVDLAAIPAPMGTVPVVAGERWNFQGWFRDSSGGAASSNFTPGLSVPFR